MAVQVEQAVLLAGLREPQLEAAVQALLPVEGVTSHQDPEVPLRQGQLPVGFPAAE